MCPLRPAGVSLLAAIPQLRVLRRILPLPGAGQDLHQVLQKRQGQEWQTQVGHTKVYRTIILCRFCQKRLIVLPYNWGDNTPDRITLDDGQLYRRPETQVDQPYTSSAKCPQDPSHTEITQPDAGALPVPRNPQTTRRTTPARRSQPPRNAYPKIPTNPKTTERPRQPKGPVSIGSGYCTDGGECVMGKDCPSFNDLKSDWKSLARGSESGMRKLESTESNIFGQFAFG